MVKKNGRLNVCDNQLSLKKMKEDSESTLTAVFLIYKIKYDYVNVI